MLADIPSRFAVSADAPATPGAGQRALGHCEIIIRIDVVEPEGRHQALLPICLAPTGATG